MTLAQLRAALQDIGFSTDTATAQNTALNSANRRVEGKRRWPWQEATAANASLAVGASTLTNLPADLLHVDTVRLENGTDYLDPEWVRPVEIRRLLHIDRDNGTPVAWSNWNGGVYVYSRADLVYTATLDYIKDPPDLAADGDIPGMPANYHDVLVWAAAAQMAFRERDWFFFGQAKQEFRERLTEMEEELGVRQRQSTREVVRSDFWGGYERADFRSR